MTHIQEAGFKVLQSDRDTKTMTLLIAISESEKGIKVIVMILIDWYCLITLAPPKNLLIQ